MLAKLHLQLRESQAWGSRGHVPQDFVWAGEELFCVLEDRLMRVSPSRLALEAVELQMTRSAALSREEELLAERMRTSATGIRRIEYHAGTRQLFVEGNGGMFLFDPASGACKEIPWQREGARLHTALSRDGVCFAAVRSRNVYITNTKSGKETRISDANGHSTMAGEGDFIHQEEFYTFRTHSFAPETRKGLHRILYLEMDESAVHIFNIANLGDLAGTVDPFRYALTGTANSKVSLKLASFDAAADRVTSLVTLGGVLPPWTEYVPRIGWLDAEHAYCVAVDRLQQRAALVSVNVETKVVKILYEETTDAWLNTSEDVLMPLHVFRDGSLLVASERSGFAHLYRLAEGKLTAVTAGADWNVQIKVRHTEGQNMVWVDEEKSVVYFIGHKDGPLQAHLYAASLLPGADANWTVRLTEAGFSNTCYVSANQFVAVRSNVTTPDHLVSFKLVFSSGSTLPNAEQISKGEAFSPQFAANPFPFAEPKFFTVASYEYTLHGMMYLPPNYDATKRYPTVIYTYGGPSVQLVEDVYAMTRSGRAARFQFIASLGFVVSILDNRGSSGRGLRFQQELQYRMGTVEIEDQTLHVKHLVDRGITDANRVAIFGTSYGGYMALIAMCKRRCEKSKLFFIYFPF